MPSLLVRLEFGPPGHYDPDKWTYEKWLELRREWKDTVRESLPLLLKLAKAVDSAVSDFDVTQEGAEETLYTLDKLLDELRKERDG